MSHTSLWRRVENTFNEFNGFDYFVYVLFSVVLASVAGLFVVVCAPYAAGSGIPEVGCMSCVWPGSG